jgi:tetratricopeptide (TPR) repeat protein
MDLDNLVVKLCIRITQAEFDGRLDEARSLALLAWQASQDDYEACMAAHYVARFQDDPQDILHWNREALQRALHSLDDRVKDFYPSLYLNMGRSYELLGDALEAQKYYDLAAELGVPHEVES